MPNEFAAVERLVADAIEANAFPAAAIEVGRHDAVRWQFATGRLTYEADAPAATVDTLFDLASLTKVISTTPLLMRLVEARRLLLNEPVAASIPAWRSRDRIHVTLADLLEHCGGLTAWWDLYKRGGTAAEFAAEIGELPLEYIPRCRSIYSDLGFMLLGFIAADRGGATLDQQFASWLGAPDLLFRPDARLRRGIAPTEDERHWRGRLLIGEVHDENAAALGGAAGHAGLFGSAVAVGRHARLVLQTFRTETVLGSPRLAQRFVQKTRVPCSSRALGWDTMLPTSSCGTRLSHAAIGHTGFTGTSLWIDPIKDLYIVILTNRVHPTRPERTHDRLASLRPQIHDAIVEVLEGGGRAEVPC